MTGWGTGYDGSGAGYDEGKSVRAVEAGDGGGAGCDGGAGEGGMGARLIDNF